MDDTTQTASGSDSSAERMEFCRLFNDKHIRLEASRKVMNVLPEPAYHGSLAQSDVSKWIAWNVGSWLTTRGVNASIGVKKVVHGPTGAYAIDIFINQRGCHEDYRVTVRPRSVSLDLSIVACTSESNHQPTITTPMGEISMVKWSSSVNLAERSYTGGEGGGVGQLRRR